MTVDPPCDLVFCWSGGKDSAMALHELRKSAHCRVHALITTITRDYDRISMHGVPALLLEAQAAALGLPVDRVTIGKGASNEEYEEKMQEVLERYREDGVECVAFGDIFLEDLRRYREETLARIGMRGLFPIWKRDTAKLAREFISLGFRAVVTCVDSRVLGGEFAGRDFDEAFLADLPPTVDSCGENGEFHTFVYDGPIFERPIAFDRGDVVLREKRFYYFDVKPLS